MSSELSVLGPVQIVRDDGPIALARMQQRLLAALAVADGRACQVDELVDALWGERPPFSAPKLVQVYVSQLRRLLPEGVRIRTRVGAYVLEADREAVDARRFERLARESYGAGRDGNAALARSLAAQALALWRGRAYGDLADEEFARAESARLEELRLAMLEERIDAEVALGRPSEALGHALALASEHPFRERAHELAMLALYRCGRQTEALEHYAALRERLRDELGLEPGPALRELQRRILQHDSSLEPAADGATPDDSLPVPPTPLVGRERELGALAEILARREIRLLVLTGAGGSGKTRLALEAVRRAAPTYANGATLVELAPLRDPALVLPTIAKRLDVSPPSDIELLDALVGAVRPQELLLLVDNAEHLRDAAPLFAELVARAPRLTLLVTSRAVLHLSGEHVFPVQPLEEDSAVELFEQRARALSPAFRTTAANREAIGEVCARVDRLPLAIELAAGRIGTLSLSALQERLGRRLAVLTGGPRDLPARQQTLRETLDWSIGLLGPDERAVLSRLAVFSGGATLDAAEVVCRADLQTLAALVDAHLVRRLDAGDTPRFGLLETVREYALELLGHERLETERAFTVFLLCLVEQAYESTEETVWMARLEAELDNLRAALDSSAARSDPELELQLAGALWRFWWVRGYVDEGIARLSEALARAPDGLPARVRALRGIAGLAWSRGELERAEASATEAIALARETGNQEEMLGAHTILGNVANRRKDFETARGHHERAMEIRQSLGSEPVVEKLNLAVVAMESGDPATAVPLLEEVLESNRRSHDLVGVRGFATINLGQAHYRLGDVESARELFREAREAFSEIGFRAHAAHALQGLAACAAASDLHEEAARLLGRAAAELGDVVDPDDDFRGLAADVEATVRRAMGDEAFDAASAAGRVHTDP